MAITWRNVSGPTGAEELRLLGGASGQITGAFDALQRALSGYQQEQGRQFQQRKDDNTLAFRQALQNTYTTPEALQAAIADGSVARLQASFGNELNGKEVLGAAENRLGDLRRLGLAGMQYNNQVSADAAAPILSAAQAKAYQGDLEGARALAAQLDPRYQGEAIKATFGAEKDLFGLQTAKNSEVRAQASHESGLRKDAASIRASDASVAASRANTALNEFKLQDVKDERSVADLVGKFANAYQLGVAAKKKEIDEVAKLNPSMFTLGSDGKFDPSKMDSGQLAAANAFLKASGKPTLDIYTQGDTDAQQAVVNALRESGASQRAISKAMASGDLFNTGTPTAVGNDAATQARIKTLNDAAKDAIDEAAGGRANTRQEINKFLATDFAKQVADKDLAAKATKAVNKIVLEGGIDAGNGRKVYPDPSLIVNAVNSVDTFGWTSQSDIEDAVKQVIKDFQGRVSASKKIQDQNKVKQK